MRFVFACCVATAAAFWGTGPTPAASAEFYAGKTLNIIVSTGGTGTYYFLARTLGNHIPKYLPGKPAVIVKAMPGGGNVIATNYLYNVAPKDGTFIGTVNNSIPLHQVIDGTGVQYDARKFNWIGSTEARNSITAVWHTSGIKTLDQAMKTEVTLGGTGPASSIVIYPVAMNKILGTKFKVVIGYKTVNEIDVAIERGEIQGRSGNITSFTLTHPDWLPKKQITVLAQVGAKPDPEFPGVPLITDLAKTDEDRQVLKLISSPLELGQPFLAPPGVPQDRLALLRTAFQQTLADKAFIADATKLNLEVVPISAAEVERVVQETIDVSPKVLARARDAIQVPNAH